MSRLILIVEDSEMCRKALGLALCKLPGIRVHMVEKAEQALECLAAENFCALITDLRLPEMDGFGLIERVRAQPRYATLPILVVSGDGDPHTPTRVRELGADDYLQKPYSPSEMRTKLDPLIRPIA
ncbi:MAG TPA: response regulator [Bryobacteraceae bacterium]|jgi:two-component system chemotaxis response regulator CheY